MHTNVNWFEIPARDLPRATRFYERIFATTLRPEVMDTSTMSIFTRADGSGIGALVGGDWLQPSSQGTLLYLDASPSIQAVIDRIEAAGGKIAMDKMQLPNDIGYICHFMDTEGNRVALHAMA